MIDESRVINGTFGEIYLDGKCLTSFTGCEIKDEYDWQEMKLAGDRRTKHKLKGVKGSGTITGYKVTSDLQTALLTNPSQSFTIISKLADPEAYGVERVKISKVKFTANKLVKWKVDEIIEEEWEFVFDDEPELLDPIVAV